MRIKDSSPCAFCDCVFLALAKRGEFIPKGNLSPRGIYPQGEFIPKGSSSPSFDKPLREFARFCIYYHTVFC